MAETEITVGVKVIQKEDGRFYFKLLANDNTDIEMIRSVLVGGLMLTIHAEPTSKKQAKAMQEVIDYMNKDFISLDSFSDVGGPSVPNESDN